MATLLYIALKEAGRVWHQSQRVFAWNEFLKKKKKTAHRAQARRAGEHVGGPSTWARARVCLRVWVHVCRSNALSGTSLGSGGVSQQQRANRWVFITVSYAAVPSWLHKPAPAPNSAGGQTLSCERHRQRPQWCEPGSEKDGVLFFFFSFLWLPAFFFLCNLQCWW